jgi:hypothetical protein
MVTFCITFLALSANFMVMTVSSIDWLVGETVAIRSVFVLPPNESVKILVNFDSRNGMCAS